MDIAFVTGADAGPGLAIARRLLGMGCRVYALASQFPRNPYPHDDFIPLACNLADPAALTSAVEQVVASEGHVTFVVHAARRAPAPLLDAPVADLAERVNIGLLAPLALARVTLPWLRKVQGHFIVLAWNGDGPAPGGPVTAAIEGGLHHFAEALFEELRNDGVRATTIYARPNEVTAPEAEMSLDPQSAVNPELLADAVEHILRLRPSNVVSSLVVRPAATTESPRLARSTELAGLATREVQLPPRDKFPSEPEPIPTPPRARPSDAPPPEAEDYEDEDEDEEEDDWDPQREPLPWAQREQDGRRQDGPPQGDGQQRHQGGQRPQHGGRPQQGQPYPQDGQGRGRRRRRRGGRGRGREQYGDRPPYPGDRQQQPGQRPPNGPPPSSGTRAEDYPDAEAEDAQRRSLRDESFRTPHSDDDADGPQDEGMDAPREGADAGPNPDTDFEARPPHEDGGPTNPRPPSNPGDDDEGFGVSEADERHAPEPQPAGASGDAGPRAPRPGGGVTSGFGIGQRPPQGQGRGQGHGQGHGYGGGRRHRRPGRTPPPGGGRRGPDGD